jgi:hypothetical protein
MRTDENIKHIVYSELYANDVFWIGLNGSIGTILGVYTAVTMSPGIGLFMIGTGIGQLVRMRNMYG